MKRAVALQPLSHQHHNSLMACLLINKGIQKKADPNIISDFIGNLYKEDLLPHFSKEEQLIFPSLPSSTRKLLQREHETLRILAERIHKERTHPVINTFSKLLEQHIRFEERVIFNEVQEHNSSEQMEQIANGLKDTVARKCSDYPNKFWE
jgi:hemerythrin superfamily protein